MSVTGAAFADPDVVALYDLRAPYPDAVFDRIAASTPARDHALDVGCGTGKGTRPLAARFARVTALDPSAAMIAAAGRDPRPNVRLMCSTAEAADLPPGLDLAFFGESIHWIDPGAFFPRLARALNPAHRIAVLTGGDAPAAPDWHDAWAAFLTDWVPKTTGTAFAPGQYRDHTSRYRDWLADVTEEIVVSDPIDQDLADFVALQHSRASFTAARLGAERAAFDRDLIARLAPFTDAAGKLRYVTRSKIVLGRLNPEGLS